MGCFQSKKRIIPKTIHATSTHKSEDVTTITLPIKPGTFIALRKGNVSEEYEFIKLLGVGSYGKVHKAIHRITGEVRAVKTVRKTGSPKDHSDEAGSICEVDILRVLNHPNIMKLYEYYEEPRNLQIVTEFVAGGEFFDFIVASKRLSEPIGAHFFRQLLSAVCYIHSLGIVHRDLKPENLLLESSSMTATLKLIDFGTACFIRPGQKLSKQYGTAYYIAPEVLARSYDEMCDIWSCGVILYILLSGRPPFYGKNDAEILEAVKRGKYTFSSPIWNCVSPLAKDLITRLLQYDPSDRLTAREAMDHEWFQTSSRQASSSRAPVLSEVLTNLGQFRASQKLQHAVLTFIVTQIAVRQDMQHFISTFQKLDSNGDGRISKQELYDEYSKIMGEAEAQDEVEWIMKQVDVDSSGYIDYSEFVMAVSKKEALINKTNLETCFKSFDADGNGTISSSELKTILGNGSINDSDVWTRLIAEVDANGDGVIDLLHHH